MAVLTSILQVLLRPMVKKNVLKTLMIVDDAPSIKHTLIPRFYGW